MLSDGRASNWGQCLLICEPLGELLNGEIHAKELPQEILHFLRGKPNDKNEVTGDEINDIEEIFYEKSNYNDSIWYDLTRNLTKIFGFPYVIKCGDIADLANFAKKYRVNVVGNIE